MAAGVIHTVLGFRGKKNIFAIFRVFEVVPGGSFTFVNLCGPMVGGAVEQRSEFSARPVINLPGTERPLLLNPIVVVFGILPIFDAILPVPQICAEKAVGAVPAVVKEGRALAALAVQRMNNFKAVFAVDEIDAELRAERHSAELTILELHCAVAVLQVLGLIPRMT